MAAKKKKKTAAKKPAAKKAAKKKAAKKKAAKKKPAAKKKKPAAKKKKPAAKKAAPKQKAAKHDVAGKGASDAGFAIALPGRKTINIASAYKGDNLDHHPVSKRDMDAVRSEGLRSDGEILHVEESEFAPCRLVDHGEGRFSLCFDDFRMPSVPLFESRGLQGGGYTWEAVASSLVKLKRPDLESDLSYDSEAGMFVALGGRESLKGVATLIQKALADPALLRDAVDHADPDRLE